MLSVKEQRAFQGGQLQTSPERDASVLEVREARNHDRHSLHSPVLHPNRCARLLKTLADLFLSQMKRCFLPFLLLGTDR